ncbi:MAG: carbohydrate ABC transporter permease [Ruthenibacterium sp.]
MKDIKGKMLRGATLVVLSAYALTVIYPLLWMLVSGFKTNKEIFGNTWALPKNWSFDNYIAAWDIGVGTYFANSVIVTVIAMLLTVVFAALIAFVLARFEFRMKTFLFILVLGGMMLSPEVSLISLYKMMQGMGIYNTYWALIIPYTAFRIPFTTFLMWSYFKDLPIEIEESAYLDGCTTFQIFTRMILPMSKPVVATSALLAAMTFWNEFMFGLVFIESTALKTIPIGLMNLRGTLTTKWSIMLAGLTISALPMIVVFLIFQKQLVRGMTAGGVKG